MPSKYNFTNNQEYENKVLKIEDDDSILIVAKSTPALNLTNTCQPVTTNIK